MRSSPHLVLLAVPTCMHMQYFIRSASPIAAHSIILLVTFIDLAHPVLYLRFELHIDRLTGL